MHKLAFKIISETSTVHSLSPAQTKERTSIVHFGYRAAEAPKGGVLIMHLCNESHTPAECWMLPADEAEQPTCSSAGSACLAILPEIRPSSTQASSSASAAGASARSSKLHLLSCAGAHECTGFMHTCAIRD